MLHIYWSSHRQVLLVLAILLISYMYCFNKHNLLTLNWYFSWYIVRTDIFGALAERYFWCNIGALTNRYNSCYNGLTDRYFLCCALKNQVLLMLYWCTHKEILMRIYQGVLTNRSFWCYIWVFSQTGTFDVIFGCSHKQVHTWILWM